MPPHDDPDQSAADSVCTIGGMIRETRIVTIAAPEVRRELRADEEDSEESVTFVGHAAVFNERTLIGSRRFGFYEEIAPGAFNSALERSDVRMLHNHDPNIVLGRSTSGSLRLGEDDRGLAVEDDFPATSQARDLALLLERGDISQMSFAFTVRTDQWEILDEDDGAFELRTILEFDELFDVSTVTYPAYKTTDAGLRAADDAEVRAVLDRHNAEKEDNALLRSMVLLDIATARQNTRARTLKRG